MDAPAEFTLAAIQSTPVLLDRAASTAKACDLILAAGRRGATVAAFGEAWIPGYPFFHGGQLHPDLWYEAAALYLANAVEIPSATTEQLCDAARTAGVDVVIGVGELDSRTRGTVYCTLLFVGREGKVLGRHRKLKPTSTERAVWGDGDALGLKVYDRAYGRVSGLNCWEHNMVLPGFALMAQGTQIHVAAWTGGDPGVIPRAPFPAYARQLLLSRAFASQGACYVVAAGGLRSLEAVPERFRPLMGTTSRGGSCIIDPRGEVVAGPAEGETILMASGSLAAVAAAKAACDVAGHYSRADVFRLTVNGVPIGEQPL